MNLERVREILEGTLEAGRMTAKAKAELQEAFEMVDQKVKENQARDRAREMGLSTSYVSFNIEREIASAISVFCNHPKTYDAASEDVKKMDEMQQDLLHALELLDETVEEKMKYTEDLIVLRKQRRLAKNYMEVAKPIKFLVSKYPSIQKDLNKCLQQVKEQMSAQEKRSYHPRRLTALQEAFKQAATTTEEQTN